jgi:hypothetical protein
MEFEAQKNLRFTLARDVTQDNDHACETSAA